MYAQNIPKKIYLDYVLKLPGCLCVIDAPLPDRNKDNITKKFYAHNSFVVSIFALIKVFRCRNPPRTI